MKFPSVMLLLASALASSVVDCSAESAGAPVRVALVSDPHIAVDTAPEDRALYRPRFERVIAAVNAADVDVVLLAGDLTQLGSPAEMALFKTLVAGFKAPTAWVPGNHDVGSKRLPGKTGGITAARLAAFERELGGSCWARDFGRLRVIGLNSQLCGSGLPQEQDLWALLERETVRPVRQPAIVLMHMPPFVKSADEPGGDYWGFEPEPRGRLLALLARGGIRTVLAGHLHYELVNRHAGTTFIVTQPVSFGLPRGKAPQGWTLVTVDAAGEATWQPRPISD